ncbi:hypothetical protein MRB53_040257 [Persea americana]|nr:hypothetical protein MRB53_040257 [Persea americana]
MEGILERGSRLGMRMDPGRLSSHVNGRRRRRLFSWHRMGRHGYGHGMVDQNEYGSCHGHAKLLRGINGQFRCPFFTILVLKSM